MPKLNRKQIFDYHFHLPNLNEQRRMVGYLDNVQQQVNAIERVQRDTEMELQRLEQSILNRAFHGEL
jgi:type I restriction enzyme S subunit